MSEFHVEVGLLEKVEKHPNADSLSIGEIHGYPVIFRTGDYAEGEKVVHVPIDAVVPMDDPQWEFLGKHNRIKAKRLRSVFSMGLLAKAKPEWEVGQDVQEAMRILRWDNDPYDNKSTGHPGSRFESAPRVPAPKTATPLPVYDIEGLRKYKSHLEEGEEVAISEKIHGSSARYLWDGEKLHVGSRKEFKDSSMESDLWTRVATRYDLATKLKPYPQMALYGEVYGQVQDLKYGAGQDDVRFAAFDVFDSVAGKWLDFAAFESLCQSVGIPMVPLLYKGPWRVDLMALAEGHSVLPGANHVREGIVVKPLQERWERRLGRVILKMPGQGYHLRDKNGQPPAELADIVEAADKMTAELYKAKLQAAVRDLPTQS